MLDGGFNPVEKYCPKCGCKKKIVATTTLLLLRSAVYLKKLQIFLQLDTLPCQNILKTSQSNGMNFIVPLQLKKLTF